MTHLMEFLAPVGSSPGLLALSILVSTFLLEDVAIGYAGFLSDHVPRRRGETSEVAVRAPRLQRCEYCGEELGVFAHHPRDGHLHCGDLNCAREAARDERDDARAEQEDARAAAEADEYARYR